MLIFTLDWKFVRPSVNTPIWSKQYQYPLATNAFVEKKLYDRLESPNSGSTKNDINKDGTPKLRMVLGFKK